MVKHEEQKVTGFTVQATLSAAPRVGPSVVYRMLGTLASGAQFGLKQAEVAGTIAAGERRAPGAGARAGGPVTCTAPVISSSAAVSDRCSTRTGSAASGELVTSDGAMVNGVPSDVDGGEIESLRLHHARPRPSSIGGGHPDDGVVMPRCTDEFGKKEVRSVCDGRSHRFIDARARIQNDEPMGRWV